MIIMIIIKKCNVNNNNNDYDNIDIFFYEYV